MLTVSCSKDPVFEQGDYIYEDNDFTKVDNINGILIHWTDDMEISEEQKVVILDLIGNLVQVKGGSFMMGAQHTDDHSDNYDVEAQENENPVHQVTLSDYFIGQFEITQRQWRTIMGYELVWQEQYGRGDDYPAYNVSWAAANAFVDQLSAMTNLNFQLPSEAQWEYAARGGNKSQHYRYSGSDNVDMVAWHKDNSDGTLHPVGGKQANELRLYDMSGSLWEWCMDTYKPYSNTPQMNPIAESGNKYVLRGGAWTYFPTYCRITCRDSFAGNAASISVGFRVAMSQQ